MRKLLCALLLVLMVAVSFTSCGLTVERPEVKKGEFDFSITYELYGEVKTLSAVYICEFDGTSWSLDGGYGRDWKSWTEGDYEGDDDYSAIIGTTEDGGDIILFFGIYPEYFMNDPASDRGGPEPSIYISYPENENGESGLVNIPEEVEALCGAKIVSCEYDLPIENSFGMFNF